MNDIGYRVFKQLDVICIDIILIINALVFGYIAFILKNDLLAFICISILTIVTSLALLAGYRLGKYSKK